MSQLEARLKESDGSSPEEQTQLRDGLDAIREAAKATATEATMESSRVLQVCPSCCSAYPHVFDFSRLLGGAFDSTLLSRVCSSLLDSATPSLKTLKLNALSWKLRLQKRSNNLHRVKPLWKPSVHLRLSSWRRPLALTLLGQPSNGL
jgi:hypothetical protein